MSYHKLKYDWIAVQLFYSSGATQRETIKHFGMSFGTWSKAAKAGRIKTEDRKTPTTELLKLGIKRNRTHLKKRLIKENVLTCECYICHLKEWLSRPISLQIDHINGNKLDWRVDNLRLLCPNCHSQTPTFSGRNIGKSFNG